MILSENPNMSLRAPTLCKHQVFRNSSHHSKLPIWNPLKTKTNILAGDPNQLGWSSPEDKDKTISKPYANQAIASGPKRCRPIPICGNTLWRWMCRAQKPIGNFQVLTNESVQHQLPNSAASAEGLHDLAQLAKFRYPARGFSESRNSRDIFFCSKM